MAKYERVKEIKTVAYIHRGDELVNIDELAPEERKKVSVQLTKMFYNSLLRPYGIEAVTQEDIDAALAAGETVELMRPDGTIYEAKPGMVHERWIVSDRCSPSVTAKP